MPNGTEAQQRNDNAALRNAGFQTIVKTTHILNHPAATIMLVLDEETGQVDFYPCSPPPKEEQLAEFHRDSGRWCRQIAREWVQRYCNSAEES